MAVDASAWRGLHDDYGRSPALFAHTVQLHPLLSLDALATAAGRWRPSAVEARHGATALDGDQAAAAAQHLVEGMPGGAAWVVLKDIQDDEVYGPLARDLFAWLRRAAGEQASRVDERAHIFIASPGVETPLHADDNQGFLLHLAGGKTLTLFDMGPRHFSPALARRRAGSSRVFSLPAAWPARPVELALAPGQAVHIPWQWPHRACTTGPSPSISLNVGFESYRTRRNLRASCLNDDLMTWGIRPRAVGVSAVRDTVKAGLSLLSPLVRRR